jgi:hypothetical protein
LRTRAIFEETGLVGGAIAARSIRAGLAAAHM